MLLVQWYTLAVLCGDAYELRCLWNSTSSTLSGGSYWFDSGADAPMGVALYSGLIICLLLPRLFILAEPLSRWVLMLETIHNAIRVLLYSGLFTVNQAASQVNTMLITFAIWNTFFYGRTYYSTMLMLREHSK